MNCNLAPGRPISRTELKTFLGEALAGIGRPGEHIVVVIPDDTRSLPMSTIFGAVCSALAPRVDSLTFLVALGTHPPMTKAQMEGHLGKSHGRWSNVRVVQHVWNDPTALLKIGTVSAEELNVISGGLLAEEVPVRINRLALEADRVLIVNPVFPHEVVGFSGGHKYFFPGISGAEMVDVSHWLGALITNPKVNGHKQTPVRTLIERAAEMVPTPRHGIALVTKGQDTIGVFVDDVQSAWSAAVDLSAAANIVWMEHPFHTVISVAPAMYRDLWTAGKCMYKVEPVIADGGTAIIYAPHIGSVSATHGEWIAGVGYHTRDFFTKQWDRYSGVPRAVLAHSTHVRGIGTYKHGVERPRVRVLLATGIGEDVCRQVNLGYVRPESIDVDDLARQQDDGILVVPNAGETLYRLADDTVPDIDVL